MAFNWDFLIGLIVVVGLGLIIWAKVSKQTIAEVIVSIKDMFADKAEDVQERASEVIMYE